MMWSFNICDNSSYIDITIFIIGVIIVVYDLGVKLRHRDVHSFVRNLGLVRITGTFSAS